MYRKFRKKPQVVIWLAGILIIALIICGFIIGRHPGPINYLLTLLEDFRNKSYIWGLVVSEVAQILITLCGLLPASTGAIASGMFYGIGTGFLLSASATLIGSLISFFLSRSIFRPLIERWILRSPRMNQIDHLVQEDAWKLVCLLRISPIMPFALTSYALGLTCISVRSYLIGTLASMPALFGYVVMGHIAGSGATAIHSHQISTLKTVLLIIAFVGTAVLVWHVGRLIHKMLKLPENAVINNQKEY